VSKYFPEHFRFQILSIFVQPQNKGHDGVIMLAGLPADYKPMVMALESSEAKITSDLVKNKLLQEDIKRQFEKKNSSEVAFAAKTRR
jgi:hypothetical protein